MYNTTDAVCKSEGLLVNQIIELNNWVDTDGPKGSPVGNRRCKNKFCNNVLKINFQNFKQE